MKRSLLALILLGIAPSALAQPAVSHKDVVASPSLAFMPPHDMADRAISEDPGVQEASAKLKAAQAEAMGRQAGPYQFTLHGDYDKRAVSGRGALDEFTVGVSRAVRLPGKAQADEKIADYTVALAQNYLGDSRHVAATNLKKLWLAWSSAETETAMAEQEVLSRQREVDATLRSQQLKQAASLQVEQVQAALAQARAQAADAARMRQDARMTLMRSFPTLALPDRPMPMPEPQALPGDWGEWRAAVIDDNHDVNIARSEAGRREWLAHRASLDKFADPTFDVYSFQQQGGHETGFGVGFSMPIGGAARSAAAEQAAHEFSAASVNLRKAERDLEIAADHDVIAAQQGLLSWRQSQEAALASGKALAHMKRAYELGDLGLGELLLAERQDFESRRMEIRARGAAHDAVLQLMIDAHRVWSLGEE